MSAPVPAGAASAMMHPRGGARGGSAIAVLFACCPRPTIALWGLTYLLFAALPVCIALASGGALDRRAALFAVLLPAIGTGVLWFGWVSRLLLLHIESRTSCMPGLARAASLAMASMFALTVLLPGALLTIKGLPWTLAFGALATAAIGGLLSAWLPAMATAAIFALTLALNQFATWMPDAFADARLFASASQLVPLAVALALVAWWRARALIRSVGEGRALSRLQRPVLLNGAYGDLGSMRTQDGKGRELARANATWTTGRVAACLGPDTPVRALQTWLGPPFARRSLRYWMLQGGLVALVILMLSTTIGDDLAEAWPAILGGFALLWVMVGSVDPIQRLRYLQGSRSGEFALLGVLPGWTDGAAARRLMLRAVFAGRMWRSLPALPVLIAVLAYTDAPPMHYWLVALMFAALPIVGWALAMRAMMAGTSSAAFGALMIVVGLGLMLPAMSVLADRTAVGLLDCMLLAWSITLMAGSISLLRSVRRFRALPHPFVQA